MAEHVPPLPQLDSIYLMKALRYIMDYMTQNDPNVMYLRGERNSFTEYGVHPRHFNPGTWLDGMLESGGAETLAARNSQAAVDMDADPRVREFTEDETKRTRDWIQLNSEIADVIKVLSVRRSCSFC